MKYKNCFQYEYVVIYTLNQFSYFVMRVCGHRQQNFFSNVARHTTSLPTPDLVNTLNKQYKNIDEFVCDIENEAIPLFHIILNFPFCEKFTLIVYFPRTVKVFMDIIIWEIMLLNFYIVNYVLIINMKSVKLCTPS